MLGATKTSWGTVDRQVEVITTSPSWLAMAWEAQSLSLAVLPRKALVVARVALSLPWLMMTLEALAPLWLVIAREALSLS